MPTYTEAQREIIKKQIWDMEREGFNNQKIQQKLETMGYRLSIRQIDRYKGGIAAEIASDNKDIITFTKLQLESDIIDAIHNAERGLHEKDGEKEKSRLERDEWHQTIINLRSRLVLTRKGIIDGIDINDDRLLPETGNAGSKRKEATKEFREFMDSAEGKQQNT